MADGKEVWWASSPGRTVRGRAEMSANVWQVVVEGGLGRPRRHLVRYYFDTGRREW